VPDRTTAGLATGRRVPVDQLPSLAPTPIRYEESNGGPSDASRGATPRLGD